MRIALVGAGRIGAFHAESLGAMAGVDELLIADAVPARAAALAGRIGARACPSVDDAFDAHPDAVVISATTDAHADLIVRAARSGLPVYCEKPVAVDLAGTVTALREVQHAGTVLQMGFQRRFDAGYAAARAAVRAGRLGRLHTVRAMTSDAAPPPASYVSGSGGLYRDCLVHDVDILRWITGREVTDVYAVGANAGAGYFRAAGDVDTAAALLTMDDGTLVTATATRYNGAGYDARMELAGTLDQIAVGLDPRTPLTSVEPGSAGPPGHPWDGFLTRFASAYRAELAVFLEVVAGRADNPCSGEEALAALQVAEACELSRRERRPVRLYEIQERTAEAASAVEVGA